MATNCCVLLRTKKDKQDKVTGEMIHLVSRFSHQNDAGLNARNVVLRENFVLVVVFVLESKAL